eukprot:364988-Chlamydomonas_euryale.AAC.14
MTGAPGTQPKHVPKSSPAIVGTLAWHGQLSIFSQAAQNPRTIRAPQVLRPNVPLPLTHPWMCTLGQECSLQKDPAHWRTKMK